MEIKKSSKRAGRALIFLFVFSCLILPSDETFNTVTAVHGLRLDPTSYLANVAYQYQNVTHDGDLIISDNETFAVENSEFYMNGTITAKDGATLSIVNSKFTTIPSRYTDGDSIILNGHSNLIIKNSTVIFKRPGGFDCEIRVLDNAKANVTSSTFRNRGFVVAFNNSVVHVTNSTITTSTRVGAYPMSGVAAFGTSKAIVHNSIMDGVFVWDNSTVSITNSVLGILRTTWKEIDRATVNIKNSRMDEVEIVSGSPMVHFEGSTVLNANIYGGNVWFIDGSLDKMSSRNANIWLMDSSYGSIENNGNATIIVGWHLPLFGLVSMPYTWVPIVRLVPVAALVGIVITALVLLYRKRAQRIQREELQIKKSRLENLQCLRYYLKQV